MLHQRQFASLYLFFCVCCASAECLHTNDVFALSEKSAEKKTKTGRLPIAHYKQKPAGSDLWPVNRCIPIIYIKIHCLPFNLSDVQFFLPLSFLFVLYPFMFLFICCPLFFHIFLCLFNFLKSFFHYRINRWHISAHLTSLSSASFIVCALAC